MCVFLWMRQVTSLVPWDGGGWMLMNLDIVDVPLFSALSLTLTHVILSLAIITTRTLKLLMPWMKPHIIVTFSTPTCFNCSWRFTWIEHQVMVQWDKVLSEENSGWVPKERTRLKDSGYPSITCILCFHEPDKFHCQSIYRTASS